MEPKVEEIQGWIEQAIDGVKIKNEDAILTLNVVCPKQQNWHAWDFKRGDIILEKVDLRGQREPDQNDQFDEALWKIYCIVTSSLWIKTKADIEAGLVAETVRRILLEGSGMGPLACGGLAMRLDCPAIDFLDMAGGYGVVAEMTIWVQYLKEIKRDVVPISKHIDYYTAKGFPMEDLTA